MLELTKRKGKIVKTYSFRFRKLTCFTILLVLSFCVLDTRAVEIDANAAKRLPQPNIPAGTAAEPGKTSVAVTVKGFDITEAVVDAEVRQQFRKMKVPAQMAPMFLEQYKKQLRDQALESLVGKVLVEQEIKKAQIIVTEEETTGQITKMASQQQPPLTFEDIKALIEAHGKSFDEWKQQIRKRLVYQKFFEALWAGKINVTQDNAKKYYSENEKQFETPEQVKVSHIFILPDTADPSTDANQAKAKARAKTENLLGQIKAGADFGALARAHSGDNRSGVRGGAVADFINRNSNVPEPFKEAAFKLKVGQVSDVVETRSGFHIIKVTEHKDPNVITFKQAKDGIIKMLTQQRQAELAKQYVESLKTKAKLVYPPGKEPKSDDIGMGIGAPKPAPADSNATAETKDKPPDK